MVKLTPDLIVNAAQYTNPVKDRELDLRGIIQKTRLFSSWSFNENVN